MPGGDGRGTSQRGAPGRPRQRRRWSKRWWRSRVHRLLGRRERSASSAVVVATERVAALLRGGIPATRAWRILANERIRDGPPEGPEPGPERQRIAERLELGDASSEALAAAGGPEWRVLAAAWWLAEQSGSPLAAMLDRFGQSMRALGRVSERRSVLLAGPRATIRLVAALPVAALLLGALLGFDPVSGMRSPVAGASVLFGVLLLLLGVRWATALAARVARADWVAGWEFELMALAVAGGAPPGVSLRRSIDSADRFGAEWVRLEEFGPSGGVVAVLAEAESLGSPVAPMLLGMAEARRARALTELERAAERLGVRVLVPLGVCILPSFVLLGVVPVLLAVLGGA
nr:type II secretion system F family protein [Leucobacter soli]